MRKRGCVFLFFLGVGGRGRGRGGGLGREDFWGWVVDVGVGGWGRGEGGGWGGPKRSCLVLYEFISGKQNERKKKDIWRDKKTDRKTGLIGRLIDRSMDIKNRREID